MWNTGKEVRIGNFRVDAYSASKNEIIEVSGCYWHSHECFPGLVRSPEQVARYEKTVARAQFIEEVTGIKVKLVWECQIPRHIKDGRPPVYLDLKKKAGKQIMSQGELLALVKTGKFFGAVEVDIEVPDSLKEKFSEFAPLFVTCEIPMTKEVIGEHMYKYVEEQHLSLKPRKQLVAGLKARQILLATPLLQWYLSKGLKVTRVYQAIEWNSQPCLQKFFETVAQDRRQASGDPTKEAHAAKQKLTANSAYGATLLNKLNYTHIHYMTENETNFAAHSTISVTMNGSLTLANIIFRGNVVRNIMSTTKKPQVSLNWKKVGLPSQDCAQKRTVSNYVTVEKNQL